MNKLNTKEIDLLERIEAKSELRALFFRKVKGLKWFDALHDRGYFKPENMPVPVPAKEEGYVRIPYWEVADYLVKTVPELTEENASLFVPKFMDIIVEVTTYAKNNGSSNYRVWWKFAEILSQIPTEFVSPDQLAVVDFWLSDKYENELVAEVIGEKWCPRLLERSDEKSLPLARRLLDILFSVDFSTEEIAGVSRTKASFRFDNYRAERIQKKIADLAGCRLGEVAVGFFQSKLIEVLDRLKNDTWSSVWHPAIEEHEQNKYRDDAENILLKAFRDSLCSYMKEDATEAVAYVRDLLESPYQTIRRIAIYCIGSYFQNCLSLVDELINDMYFQANYRHEIWHFLNNNYQTFSPAQKSKVWDIIQSKVRKKENETEMEGASAYERSIWLAAIKNFGEEEAKRYRRAVEIAKTEPDYPDFSSYSTSGWGGQKSPYSVEELSVLSVSDLIKTLTGYHGNGGWQEPGIEGLTRAVKQLFKSDPLYFGGKLNRFLNLDLAYIYSIIEAYSELWNEKASIPWDELWQYLLTYIKAILCQDRFWDPENAKQREDFVANRYWIVGAIARLLESGSQSDNHAFPEKHHDSVETILKILLEKESGERFELDSDAVSISINSPRGQCIEALINLALRACRLEDRANNGDHSATWEHYCLYFDAELERTGNGEYEFATLVANYLPNFLFMSRKWLFENLPRIFDQTNHLKWLCAMQGYSYVNTVDKEIYSFLKEHGDFLLALDDENIKDNVEEKVIQHIVIAYLNDFDMQEDEGSLIHKILNRNVPDELSHLIWFIWTLNKDSDDKLRKKVYELWPLLLEKVNFSLKKGKQLASDLCKWTVFIEHLDDERMELLIAIAPYADESHNSYEMLESLARISRKQPFEANTIWEKMLQDSVFDYPEEAIREILTNLVRSGPDGIRAAKNTVSKYLERGLERPSMWLKDILDSSE